MAVKRLRDQPQDNRVLILLTDGDNTSGEVAPEQAAQLAKREHIRIYTIGIGADQLVVQGFFGQQRVANTDLDEATLKAIAETTGGRYFRARDISQLQKIYHLLDAIEPVSKDQQTFRPVDEMYRWPLGAALIFTLLIALAQTPGLSRLSTRKSTRQSTREIHHA